MLVKGFMPTDSVLTSDSMIPQTSSPYTKQEKNNEY